MKTDAIPLQAHTPIQLRVLLHYAFTGIPWADHHTVSSDISDVIGYWARVGCIEVCPISEQRSGLRVTDRGQRMVDAWLSTPLPVVLVPEAPDAVMRAMLHVRKFLPEVDRVVYDQDGRWEYSAKGGSKTGWHELIQVDILEDGANAVPGFPAVFEVKEDV